MVFDYVGSVSTYAVLPFFAALGPGVMALRLMCIAGGAATVALTYLWGRSLFHSRWVGAAAALLLATHPSFVFYARQGVHVSSLMALSSTPMALAILRALIKSNGTPVKSIADADGG